MTERTAKEIREKAMLDKIVALTAERDALREELKLREAQVSGVEVRLRDLAAKLERAEQLGDALAKAAQSDWDCTDDRGDDAMRIAARLDAALTAWREHRGQS